MYVGREDAGAHEPVPIWLKVLKLLGALDRGQETGLAVPGEDRERARGKLRSDKVRVLVTRDVADGREVLERFPAVVHGRAGGVLPVALADAQPQPVAFALAGDEVVLPVAVPVTHRQHLRRPWHSHVGRNACIEVRAATVTTASPACAWLRPARRDQSERCRPWSAPLSESKPAGPVNFPSVSPKPPEPLPVRMLMRAGSVACRNVADAVTAHVTGSHDARVAASRRPARSWRSPGRPVLVPGMTYR